MDWNGQLVLCFLEEDNPQRGHFRVRPLLTAQGPVPQEQVDELKDEGYIRVVPDKNEQRTFKDRMRTLGSLCVMDLRSSSKENGKFKQNRSYAPARGEKNRFIVYSDAVAGMPADSFFEVLSESRIREAVTPLAYTRKGGRIHGPVDRVSGETLASDRQLQPDDARLFSVTLPDGATRLFYWPGAEKEAPGAEAPVREQPEEAAEEPEKPLREGEAPSALDLIRELNGQMVAHMKGEDEKKEAPEPVVISQTGTPLYHAVLPPAGERAEAVNPLSKAVENSRRKAKPEEKADDRPPKAAEKEEKPDEEKKARTKADKKSRKDQPAPKAEENPAAAPRDAGETLLRAQIQDLEAERLMAVMNLEKARADEEKYRQELLEKAEDAQKEREQAAQGRLDALKAQIAALEEERNEAARMAAEAGRAGAGALRLTAAEPCPAQTVRDRLCTALRERGLAHTPELALSVLIAWAVSEDGVLCVNADHPLDLTDAGEALAAALGAPFARCAYDVLGAGESAAVTAYPSAPSVLPKAPGLIVLTGESGDDVFAPVLRLTQSAEEPADGLSGFAPVDAAALRAELTGGMTALSAEASALIEKARELAQKGGQALPVRGVRALKRFLMAAQGRLPGGIKTAADIGLTWYVLPFALSPETKDAFKALCAGLPLCLRALEKAV